MAAPSDSSGFYSLRQALQDASDAVDQTRQELDQARAAWTEVARSFADGTGERALAAASLTSAEYRAFEAAATERGARDALNAAITSWLSDDASGAALE